MVDEMPLLQELHIVSNGGHITIDFTEFINDALFATTAPQNNKSPKTFQQLTSAPLAESDCQC